MIFLWGTKGVTKTEATGQFYCPSCLETTQYSLKSVRKWFTVYFVPVIPLEKVVDYVECQNCKETYKRQVLEADKPDEKLLSEFRRTALGIMVSMLLVDGHIDEEEITMVQSIYNQLTKKPIPRDALLGVVNSIKSSKPDVLSTLHKMSWSLNDEGKEIILKAAFYVAMADGHLRDEEKRYLISIGKALQMSDSHIKGVILTLMSRD